MVMIILYFIPEGINDAKRMAENTALTKRFGAPARFRPSSETKRKIQRYVEIQKISPRMNWIVGMPQNGYTTSKDYQN
jgi:hypothetical protein